MKALMNHQFFEGINFQTDLTQLDIKKKLDESDYEEPTSPTMEFDIESETGAREFIVQKFGEKKPNEPILEGALMKKNTWNWRWKGRTRLRHTRLIVRLHLYC